MMRKTGLVVVLTVACTLALTGLSMAANHVRIDTASNVPLGKVDTIGIYLSNDVPINGAVFTFEIRSVSGGAYPTTAGFNWGFNPPGRLANSALGAGYFPTDCNDDFDPSDCQRVPAQVVLSRYPTPNNTNPCTQAPYNTYTASGAVDGTSPDGLLLATVSSGVEPQEVSLAAGSDPDGTPSLRIICNVGNTPGIFVIDTCCIAPSNHLDLVDAATSGRIKPTFQYGAIGVNVVQAVKELETGTVPESYVLEQNYPNPFNAGTVIRFKLPSDGDVRIDVYNILGRRVRTLVNEFRVAGTHQTDWDGRSDDGTIVATGVYFYRIQAGDFTSTRKMVLMK